MEVAFHNNNNSEFTLKTTFPMLMNDIYSYSTKMSIYYWSVGIFNCLFTSFL